MRQIIVIVDLLFMGHWLHSTLLDDRIECMPKCSVPSLCPVKQCDKGMCDRGCCSQM